jgi:hypothetical protein
MGGVFVETWRAASLHKTEIQTGEKIAQSTGIPVEEIKGL